MKGFISLVGCLALIATAMVPSGVLQIIALSSLIFAVIVLIIYYLRSKPVAGKLTMWAWIISAFGAVIAGFLWYKVGLVITGVGLIMFIISQGLKDRPQQEEEQSSAEIGG